MRMRTGLNFGLLVTRHKIDKYQKRERCRNGSRSILTQDWAVLNNALWRTVDGEVEGPPKSVEALDHFQRYLQEAGMTTRK